MDKHKIRSAISYIENHSNECISVAQLAEIAGYNEDYFAESFREHTGLSVAAYIRRYKITLAAFDLLAGLSSGEVAAKYGFETASGFAKAFRKCYDMSPREYKATYEWDPTPSFQFFPDIQVIAHILLPPDSSFTLAEGGAYWWRKDFNDYNPEEWAKIKTAGVGDIGAWLHTENGLQYAFGPIVNDISVVPEDMQVVTIPAAYYAIFKAPRSVLNSELHRNIVTLWNSLYEKWSAYDGYRYDEGKVAFELYHDRDTFIYLPVVPNVL